MVKRTGDGLIVEFRSVVDAVRCAIAIQSGMAERNAGVAQDERIEFRIGVHLGDVVEEADGDLMGDGVNIAARIESIADPGGICLSEDAWRQVRDKVKETFVDRGEKTLKNIARPVRIYAISTTPASAASAPGHAPAAAAEPARSSIAVLPFANMSGDAEQEYFADGISEDIITALSKLPQLFVIARNSAFTFKGKNVNIGEVGKSLGVRNVLEGSVRKAGGRVRITAQLIDATTGGHLWAEKFDRELTDIFAVQDDVTGHIVVRARAQPQPRRPAEHRRRADQQSGGLRLLPARARAMVAIHARGQPRGRAAAQARHRRSTPDLCRRSPSSPRRWPTPIRTDGARSRPTRSKRPRRRRARRSSSTSDTLTRSGRSA